VAKAQLPKAEALSTVPTLSEEQASATAAAQIVHNARRRHVRHREQRTTIFTPTASRAIS
jgi:hypothetical protein